MKERDDLSKRWIKACWVILAYCFLAYVIAGIMLTKKLGFDWFYFLFPCIVFVLPSFALLTMRVKNERG